jgi:hypothetical protein
MASSQARELEEPDDSKALTATVVGREPVRASEPDPMALIESRNKAMERLLEYAVRSTSPEQWVDQGGNPYLTAGGAQAVARRCGVKFTDVEERRETHTDEGGSYYEYVFISTVSLAGAWDRIEGVVGSCTSRDPFIGTGAGKGLSDVDPGDIRKKAQTNMTQRGITQLLGLRGLSWETLARFGVTPNGASKVEYKLGAKGGGQSGAGGYVFPFGKDSKGKSPSDPSITDKDLAFFLKAFTDNAKDPAKAKYKKSNDEGLAAVNEEIARRANAKSGATPPAKDATQPTMWQRIQTLAADYEFARGEKDADLIAAVKKATGDKPGKDLNDDDFKKVEKFISDAVKRSKSDIPY